MAPCNGYSMSHARADMRTQSLDAWRAVHDGSPGHETSSVTLSEHPAGAFTLWQCNCGSTYGLLV